MSVSNTDDSKKILFVGLCCLDMVFVCKSYPEEDSDQKCLSCQWQRGGNASNSCTVLSHLGIPCEYFGTLSSDFSGCYLRKDFIDHGICIENCILFQDCQSPTSTVIINIQTGSRTILHYNRNLPELMSEQFMKLDLSRYKWIHFEGRNVIEVKKMVNHVEHWNKDHPNHKIPISIELEKSKTSLEELFEYGHVLFIGKDFAKMCGYNSMQDTVQGISESIRPGVTLVCAWGDKGACVKNPDGTITTSSAYPPSQVIDTLAAGDTFIAATISALCCGKCTAEAIRFGCKVSGYKCGLQGFQGLNKVIEI